VRVRWQRRLVLCHRDSAGTAAADDDENSAHLFSPHFPVNNRRPESLCQSQIRQHCDDATAEAETSSEHAQSEHRSRGCHVPFVM